MSNEEKVESKVEEKTPVQEANEVLAGLKEQNERMEKNLKVAAQIASETVLSGKSLGSAQKPSDEEKKNLAAREFLKGSGYEDELFPIE